MRSRKAVATFGSVIIQQPARKLDTSRARTRLRYHYVRFESVREGDRGKVNQMKEQACSLVHCWIKPHRVRARPDEREDDDGGEGFSMIRSRWHKENRYRLENIGETLEWLIFTYSPWLLSSLFSAPSEETELISLAKSLFGQTNSSVDCITLLCQRYQFDVKLYVRSSWDFDSVLTRANSVINETLRKEAVDNRYLSRRHSTRDEHWMFVN